MSDNMQTRFVDLSLDRAAIDNAWKFGRNVVVRDGSFEQFLEDFHLKAVEVEDASRAVHNLIHDKGLESGAGSHVLILYSDQSGEDALGRGPRISEKWNAFETKVEARVGDLPLNSVIFLLPTRMKRNLSRYEPELRPYCALQVLCHGLAHAFGYGYKSGENESEKKAYALDLLADCFAFLAILTPKVPAKCFMCFPYLLRHFMSTGVACRTNEEAESRVREYIKEYSQQAKGVGLT